MQNLGKTFYVQSTPKITFPNDDYSVNLKTQKWLNIALKKNKMFLKTKLSIKISDLKFKI